MRVVIQRSKAARVVVAGNTVGAIDRGLMLLVGVTHEDTEQDVAWLADKVAGLRIFEDEAEKMNLSVQDIGGQILSVSQFTLYADCKKGKRPSFVNAARPEEANRLYEMFNERLVGHGLHVEKGIFGANMDIEFTNWGPVTIMLDSHNR